MRYYANILQRFIGSILDLSITFPIAMLVHSASIGGNLLLSQLVYMLFESLYYVIFWCTKSSTLGMMVLKIELYTDTGKVTIRRALFRYLGIYISAIFFGLGAIWMLWDRNKQTWQDKIANTYVIKTQKDAMEKMARA